MVQYQITVGLQDGACRGGRSTKLLVILNLPWQGFEKNILNIEAHAGMVDWLVRYLAIEDALQN